MHDHKSVHYVKPIQGATLEPTAHKLARYPKEALSYLSLLGMVGGSNLTVLMYLVKL
jgi:hypothetical protein